jgi:Fe-S oxidoreductase
MATLSEKLAGFSARRPLPRWRRDRFNASAAPRGPANGRELVLFSDTFNTYFEPENLTAALKVLEAGGYRIHTPAAPDGGRPLCCGRTFLAAGMVDEARAEARRTLAVLESFVVRGVPVVGLEPSCLYTLKDEYTVMLPRADTEQLAEMAMTFEEFLCDEHTAGRLNLPLKPVAAKQALLHGHCHQKAFAAMPSVEAVLRMIPGLEVATVTSSCCGMAGAFGYSADTYDISMKMGELSLLPAVREAGDDTLIVADGTSCRHQIADGTRRKPMHVAHVLEQAIDHA